MSNDAMDIELAEKRFKELSHAEQHYFNSYNHHGEQQYTLFSCFLVCLANPRPPSCYQASMRKCWCVQLMKLSSLVAT